MKYTSSPLLMFRQFLVLSLGVAAIAGLIVGLLFAWLNVESMILIYGIAGVLLLVCVCRVAIGGRVSVEVTDDEVIIARPFAEETRLSRKQWSFSSRVVSHSVNCIPTETERILIAYNNQDVQEIVLANLSKRSFDALMAIFLRDRAIAEIEAETEEAQTEISFAVPKEEMLADFRRLIVILAIGGMVLSLGLVGFIGYMLSTAHSDVPVAPLLAHVVFFCLFMFVGFGIPVYMTYSKRRRGIPPFVHITADSLMFGEERLALAEIRRIVATPPDYSIGNFIGSRAMTVHTDRGKNAYHFGVRAPGGVWKTMFTDYGEMCGELEKTAARHGFEFVYDL